MYKKAMIGKTTALWVATIVIVIMLLVFVFGSKIVRDIDNSRVSLKVYEPDEVGLKNLRDYMENQYPKIVSNRFLINQRGNYEK